MMEHFWHTIDGWIGDNNTYRKVLDEAKDGQHFVEVGVYCGRSAAFMAVEIKNRGLNVRFDAVDHFKGSAEHGDLSATLYQKALKNLEPVKDIVNVYKLSSQEAVDNYADASLDFVFIDASHDYESVLQDVRMWYPKVKPGGIFAGDDYQPSWPGVIQAVNQFAQEVKVEFTVVPDTCHWMLRKPTV
jgi:predicted O-methyltransferase YrrM